MNLTELLKKHEGIRSKPYKDTVGKITIGVGRNLDDVGLSNDEIINDIMGYITWIKNNLLLIN